jgi:hypothetical protein
MLEVTRPSGIRVRYDEDAFVLAEPPAPVRGVRRPRAGRPMGPIPMPATPTEESAEVRGILDALAGADLSLVEPLEWQPRLEATPPTGRRRAGAPAVAPQTTSVEIDINEDEQAVMLLEQDGFYSWVLPSATQPATPAVGARRGEVVPRKQTQFLIEVRPEALPGTQPRRGFVQDFIYGKVKAWVFRFAAKAGVQLGVKLLERHVKEGPVLINSATDPAAWLRPADLSKVRLPKDRAARLLLMVHGTFSSTAGAFSALCVTPWGQEFLKAALEYYDLVLGYDHRTLSEDPYSNATDLFECLTTLDARYPPHIDAVCHSRGGLVLRSLVEAILPVAGKWRAETGKCIFVAATNCGTLLAEPSNWQTLLDLYTNLAAATARALAFFPQTAAAGLVLKETVSTISALVKALASAALGADGIPGLAAMEPDGKFVTEINKTQPGQKGPADSLYYVVESDFEARLLPGGDSEPKEFPKRLVSLLADNLIDQLMREANDLVVNTRSMAAIDVAAGNFVKDQLDFGKNSAVYHTNYFTRSEVAGALVRWLALPPPGQSHIAAPGATATPTLPAVVDSDIAVIESSATAAEAAETIRDRSPSFVVVRRPHAGKTLHYAFRSEEILSAVPDFGDEDPLMDVLNLHEPDASQETGAGRHAAPPAGGGRPPARRSVLLVDDSPVGVVPESVTPASIDEAAESAAEPAAGDLESSIHRRRAMPSFGGPETRASMIRVPAPPPTAPGPAAAPAAPPPVPQTITCNFQAAMDQQVAIQQIATIDVTVSREIIAAVKGRRTATGKGEVKTSEKLIVHVAPKANFLNQGDSRVEVDPPATADPVLLSFDVRATDIGPGEVWVMFRQGAAPIAVLKLYPEVVAAAPAVTKRQSAAQPTALLPFVANPPNTLLILEQRNGNELRFRYELRSPVLGILNMYESAAIQGDRNAYVESLYKEIEDRWISSGQDVIAFQDELRAYGAQLFDSLFPPDLQQALWANRGQVESILVISEEPFIPWELVHLKAPGQALGADVCFLGQMGLVRWLHGCGYPPASIEVREDRARYIIPDYPHPDWKLPATQVERRYLEQTFHATAITPQPNPVREALKGPAAFDLLHFAGHGMAENGNIAHAQILLEGRVENNNFIPVYLSATTVEQFANLRGAEPGGNRPMVVLNACQAGRAGYVLTRIGGFASAFLTRGAGIFVAALWSVGDQPASRFVAELYDRLRAGDALAKAVATARETARKAGDATWLAYTVYGDPEARMHC